MSIIDNKIVAGGVALAAAGVLGFGAKKICGAVGLEENPAKAKSLADAPDESLANELSDMFEALGLNSNNSNSEGNGGQNLMNLIIEEGLKKTAEENAEKEALKKEVEEKQKEADQTKSELEKAKATIKDLEDHLNANKDKMEEMNKNMEAIKNALAALQQPQQTTVVTTTTTPPASPQVQEEATQETKEEVSETPKAEKTKQAKPVKAAKVVNKTQPEPAKEVEKETTGKKSKTECLAAFILARKSNYRTEIVLDDFLSKPQKYESIDFTLEALLTEEGIPTDNLLQLLRANKLIEDSVILEDFQKEPKDTIYKWVSKILKDLAADAFNKWHMEDDERTQAEIEELYKFYLDLAEAIVSITVHKLEHDNGTINQMSQLLNGIVNGTRPMSKPDRENLKGLIDDVIVEQRVIKAREEAQADTVAEIQPLTNES